MNELPDNPNPSNDLPPTAVPFPSPQANQPMGMAPRPGAERPNAVTVIGIVLLVCGSYGLLSLLRLLPALYKLASNACASRDVPFLSLCLSCLPRMFVVISITIQPIFQLIFGVSLLQMLPWARKWTVIWLTCAAVIGIVNTFIGMSILNALISAVPLSGPSAFTMIALAVMNIIFVIVVNGLMIYYLTRPVVVASFQRKMNPDYL